MKKRVVTSRKGSFFFLLIDFDEHALMCLLLISKITLTPCSKTFQKIPISYRIKSKLLKISVEAPHNLAMAHHFLFVLCLFLFPAVIQTTLPKKPTNTHSCMGMYIQTLPHISEHQYGAHSSSPTRTLLSLGFT